MATPTLITTGEQTVTGTGPVTGTLDTSGLSGDYTVFVRVRGLTSGSSMQVALEDTANASAFSDATQPYVFSFVGSGTTGAGAQTEGIVQSVRKYQMPKARFGVTNSKFRINVQAMDGSSTSLVTAWVAQ